MADKIRIQEPENEFEKWFRAKFEANEPFPSAYEAFKAGYVQGMMKAAEIESEHHVWKGALTRDK